MNHRRIKQLYMEFGTKNDNYDLNRSFTTCSFNFHENSQEINDIDIENKNLRSRGSQLNKWTKGSYFGRFKLFKATKDG